MLTSKYLNGVPNASRAAQDGSFSKTMLSERNLENVRVLNRIAAERGQSLAQMALSWVLRKPAVTSALIGASHFAQIEECLDSLRNPTFSSDELARIDRHAFDGGLNIWAESSQPDPCGDAPSR